MKIINISRRWVSRQRRLIPPEEELVNENPVELLFTKYLAKSKPEPQPPTFNQQQRTPDYKLPRSFYTQLLQQNPMGNIRNHSYKGLSLTIVPLNYSRKTPIASLYKLMQKEAPDLLMVQARPDRILNGFQLIRKKGDTFSDSLFWQQICRNGYEGMPSSEHRQRIASTLKGSSVRLKPLSLEQQREYDTETSRKVQPFRLTQTINNDAMATASFYSEWNRVPLVFCQLPEISERQHLANSLTLMELQLLFKQTCEQLAMYPPTISPRQLAQYIFPEILLHYSERYMATLLEYIAAVFKHRRVLMLTGLFQAEAVPLYLNNRSVSSILADLLPPKPQGTIMRDVSVHEVVEKHCLLDVLQHGQSLPQTELAELSTTTTMLGYYLGGVNTQSLHFRSEMYKRYLKMLRESLLSGQRLKQQEFIRQVL